MIVEKYLWQGTTKLLAVYDGSGNLIQRFEYADGRMPVAMTMTGVSYFLAYDQAGTLRAVTDGAGNIVKQIDYDSFGNVISDSDSSLTVPLGFAGGLYDPDTGLVRFGKRDYDPDTGRWTAKDPIGFAGGDTDLYGYVLNDPVNWVDPNGRFAIGAVIGMGIGIASGVSGAIAQNGSIGQILASAALGGLSGLAIGFLDPTEGIGTIALASGILGAGSDLIGQEIAMHGKGPCDNSHLNLGSIIGAGLGSAIGGVMGGQMTSMALQVGGSEALSSLVGAIGMAPSALGPAIGADLDGSSH